MERLDANAVWLWRAQGLVRVTMFWTPFAVAAGVGLGSAGGAAVGLILGLVVVSFGLLLNFIWPSLTWEYFGYALREHDLLVQRGVLFRRRSSIPHNRIQHVETRQGPLERLFGLSRVLVFTASGVAADGSIPGLATERAESLRDELARLGGDDGV